LGWLVKQSRGTLCNYFELNVQKPMSESQLLDKLTAIEVFRNRFLKRQQNFERKRLREKMRGRRQPRKKDVQALYEIKELEQKDSQSPLSANKNLPPCLFL
jgi:UDP-2,3-diacylglucosamine pyrophosphatase LpxH